MELPAEGRYFLFGLPDIGDDELKASLEQLIDDPTGIRGVNWWKPASEGIGGAVRLELDEHAAETLKSHRDALMIKNRRVVFVDKLDLPVKAITTIENDTVELVKQALADVGTESWESMVGGLRLSKNENGETWRVEGTLSELKRFETKIRRVLLNEVDDGRAKEREREREKENPPPLPSMQEAEDTTEGSPSIPDEFAMEDAQSDVLTVIDSLASLPTTGSKVVLAIDDDVSSVRFAFYVGDLTTERNVDAIVNPTDCKLRGDATPTSKAIRAAMGAANYDTIIKEEMDDSWGHFSLTEAMVTGAGCLNVSFVIHVAIPKVDWSESGKAVAPTARCYANCFKQAASKGIRSLSFPPLSIGGGNDVGVANAAVSAILDAIDDARHPFAENFDVVRFVFENGEQMNSFVEVFKRHFQVIIEVTEQIIAEFPRRRKN